MSGAGDDYDLKRCVHCAAWIPLVATKCASCDGRQDVEVPPDAGAPVRRPLQSSPFLATKALIAVNIVFYLWSLWVDASVAGPGGNVLGRLLAGPQTTTGFALAGWYSHGAVEAGQYWRAITFLFLHGNALHIGMNMLALWSLGRLCEDCFGAARFLVMYLVTGVVSGFGVSFWYSTVLGMPAAKIFPVVGASGAIFGLGGVLVMFLFRRGNVRGRAMARMLAMNLGVILVVGIIGLIPQMSNVGHVGGLLPGLVFGLFASEQFSDRLNPSIASKWQAVAALCLAATAVGLAYGVHFAFTYLASHPH